MTAVRWLVGVGLATLLAIGGACSDDDPADDGAAATTTTASDDPVGDAELPPPGALDLEPLYGEALAELGLRLTDRGGLIDRSGGGYEPSADGDHLALYVEPIGDYSVAQFIEGIRTVAIVFDDVFDRWPGLASYDVCQEPVADADADNAEPLPVTQIELTRAEAAVLDLEAATVTDLVRASRADPPGLALRVSSRIASDPAFEAIVADAEA